jgi:hypothetical protein
MGRSDHLQPIWRFSPRGKCHTNCYWHNGGSFSYINNRGSVCNTDGNRNANPNQYTVS